MTDFVTLSRELVEQALAAMRAAQEAEGLTGRSYEFDMGRQYSAAAIRALNKN